MENLPSSTNRNEVPSFNVSSSRLAWEAEARRPEPEATNATFLTTGGGLPDPKSKSLETNKQRVGGATSFMSTKASTGADTVLRPPSNYYGKTTML